MKAEPATKSLEEIDDEGDAVGPQQEPDTIYGRAFWLVFAASFALNMVANLFVLFLDRDADVCVCSFVAA